MVKASLGLKNLFFFIILNMSFIVINIIIINFKIIKLVKIYINGWRCKCGDA